MEETVERYSAPLTRLATRITGNEDSARDAVQETFLRLMGQNRKKIERSLRAWLFTVCRNLSLDARRRGKRLRSLCEAELDFRIGDEHGPAEEEIRREDASNAMSLLSELPVSQQEVIHLKLQEGLSYREISLVTHLSVGNVGYLIHTGLKKIRERMAACIKQDA